MKDAFISYAREDLPFVRDLVERLEERELDVWVDLEGIHAGEEWDERIRAGIEESDAFVFVVSPHSAASAACAREVEHAVESRKRILPVVLEEPSAELPEAVASHQWLFFGPDDDRERATEDLVQAVTVDPAFVREHTRLLVRSTEWERRGRDAGYLLRGNDLERAERWLGEAGAHEEPRPTRAQSEYVVASRRAATRRARILTASVAGGLVVALVLAGVAWFQRQAAQERARIALSRQLAAQATAVQGDGEGDLGLLLALEAHRESPTEEALGSLMTLLTLDPPLERFLHGHELEVTSAVFGPGGRWLAAAGCEVVSELDLCERYAVRLWDGETGEELPPLQTRQEIGVELAVSPDGSLLAAGAGDGSVQLWATDGWERVHTLSTGRAGVDGLAFGPDGARLVAAAARGPVAWDPASGRRLGPPGPSTRGWEDVAFHPSGDWVATAHQDGLIRLWATAPEGVAWNGAPADSLVGHRGRVVSLAVSPDGRYLVSGSWDDRVLLWELDAATPPRTLVDGRDVTDVAFDAGGARVLVTTRVGEEDGEITVIDVESGRALGSFPGRGRVASGGAEELLAFGTGDGTVGVRRLAGSPPLAQALEGGAGDALAVLPEGLLATGEPEVRIMDPASGRTLWSHDAGARRLAVSGDGSTLAALAGDTIRAWRLEGLERAAGEEGAAEAEPVAEGAAGAQRVAEPGRMSEPASGPAASAGPELVPRPLLGDGIVDPSGNAYVLALDRAGRHLAVGGASDSVRVWDLEEPGSPVASFGTPGDVYGLAFHDGRGTLFSGSEDGSVVEWELRGGMARGRFFGAHLPREDGLTAFAFGPGGDRLLTSGLSYTLLWDVEEGAPVGPAFPGSNAVFRPDGRLVAVMVYDRIVLVDARSLKVVGRQLGSHEAYAALAWGGDGGWLVSAGSEENLVWDLDPVSWRARACAVARRNPTAEEAALYLGAPSGDPPCPGAPAPRPLPEDAFALLHRGDRHLARGRTAEAEETLARAAALVEETADAELANEICWTGVTGGLPAPVMPACERAVALEPDNPSYRDSRGVGRAALGDVAGALEDLRAYVEAYGGAAGTRGRRAARRSAWIEALERGENPLDPLTLRTLDGAPF